MLTPMRYKGFTWPNNPKQYSISFERETAVHKIPHGAYVVEDLGRSCRCMRGEGEFFGPDAYETFKALANVFYEEGAGVLFHPTWQTTSAYFTELKLTQKPQKDYVAYAFTFVESFGENQTLRQVQTDEPAPQAVYHTVSAGENLWQIAYDYNTSVRALLQLNPQLDNANNIHTGGTVRVQ